MPYKLIYFPIRGLAEAIRLLLEDAGVKYEDVDVSGETWLGGKKLEHVNVGICPFGQLPNLELDGLILTQSSAILRYLARTHGYYNGDAKTLYIIDSVDDGVAKDWRKFYTDLSYPPEPVDEEKYKESKKQYLEGTQKKYLGIFERILSSNEGGKHFIAGKDISYADFILWEMVDIANILEPGILSRDYPLLSAYHQRIAERPNINAYPLYIVSGRRHGLVNFSGLGV